MIFLTQASTERRKPFLRRTKATAPPDVETTKPTTVDTTRKYNRRGNSRFKNRKEPEIARSEPEIENGTASSIASEPTSERPRGFARRRYGGGEATVLTTTTTTTTTQSTTAASEVTASSTVVSTSRRPFRIASRRRLSPRPSTSTTTEPATPGVFNVEDEGENEDGSPNNKKANRLQRPLTSLKDQNLSATNEEEKKRQGKKYSSSITKNKFNDAIKQKASQDVVDTTTEARAATENTRTTVEELNAETAIAIAAHKLLAAPIPVFTNYEEPKTTIRSTTKEYKTTNTGSNINTGVPGASILFEEFTKLTSPISEYIQTSTGTSPDTTKSSKPSTTPVSSTYYTLPDIGIPKTISFTRGSSPYTSFTSTETADFTTKSPTTLTEFKTSKYYTNSDPFTTKSYDFSRADYDRNTSPFSKTYFDFSSPISYSTPSISSSGLTGVSQTLAQPTRYLTSTDKYDSPQQFGYTSGYTGYNQDPYYTKDYLLESPATKTPDEQYQYLSSVTTQSTTDIPRTTPRKISTTIPPSYETTTLRPRRTRPTVAPFEKTTKTEPNRTYRPTKGYDYYDDSAEKFANKYFEGTKVVVHASGSIECLDMGNFPHPTSCKKFIQCARMESGATVGWEYICPKGLSFDPIGGICNWSAGLGCNEKDLEFSSRPRPEEFGI